MCCRNSIPPTTTLDNLKVKAREAYTKTFVDVAFWGGVVPGNQVRFRKFLHKYIYACEYAKCTETCIKLSSKNNENWSNVVPSLAGNSNKLIFNRQKCREIRHARSYHLESNIKMSKSFFINCIKINEISYLPRHKSTLITVIIYLQLSCTAQYFCKEL